jgi:hypothetical protein
MKKLTLLAALLVAASGCATKVRTVTANGLTKDGVYVGYWEGTCYPFLGCGIGDGKVTFCTLNADNSLTCTEQTSVDTLLARKPPKQ